MALSDLNLEALASCSRSLPSLDGFDFDATLEGSLDRAPELPPNYSSLIQSVEDASREGDLHAAKEALESLFLAQGYPDPRVGRALSLAIQHQHRDVVAYLLSEGITPSSDGIQKATLTKNTAILKLLFDTAWDINKELGWDDPPALAYAVEDADLTAWFLAHGADPNASCFTDKIPLSAAVQKAPLAIIEMLFANGGSIEHGQLLHSAIWRKLDDREIVVDYLMQKGALVNAVIFQNRPETYLMREAFGLGTPLHDAAARGDEEAAWILLSHGARTDIKDSCGFLPVERAESCGFEGVARYLREHASSRSSL